MNRITIYTDGAARGNPGPAGAGAILTDEDGRVIVEVCRYLGEMTNNQAEYRALLLAIEEAKRIGATNVVIFSDSELVVKQIKGDYRVKNEGIKPLHEKILKLLQEIGEYTIDHVLRENNKHADRLANLAIDGKIE
ncbi:MAG: ribonuclease HI family protein [Pseudomonadota bacterium]